MSDWKKLISDAKELLDLGAITDAEFETAKQEAFALRSQSNSTTPPLARPQHLDDMGTRIHSPSSTSTSPPPSFDELGTMVAGPTTLPPGLGNMGTMVGNADIEVIGSYRILELLGQGGMGSVFKGRHINEQYAKAMGDVAIKMIQPSLASDASFKSRFIKEAIFGKKLSHPNIASVIDVVDDGGVLALLMDFVEGQELTELIPEGGMAVEDVLSLLKPIASALDYLHEQGIVHRDMKPANIRVKPDGTPVILDFGIAKDTNEVDANMTQTGTAMGTQTYMAPEQMDAKRVTGAADQYALAMMAYQMLSGKLPWDASLSSARITMAKMTGDFQRLEVLETEFSSQLHEIVMKGMNLNSKSRFNNCTDFIQTLEESEHYSELNHSTELQESLITEAHGTVESRSGSLQQSTENIEDIASVTADQYKSDVHYDNDAPMMEDVSVLSSDVEINEGRTSERKPSISMIIGVVLATLILVGIVLNGRQVSTKDSDSSDSQSEVSAKKAPAKPSIKAPSKPIVFTKAEAELVARQWSDALNNHDVEAYADLVSDVVWYYLRPLPKNTVIQKKVAAFQKDPNFNQNIVNIQSSERQNELFHVSFLKDSFYKGKQGTVEAFLWIKNVDGKLLVVREGDNSSLKISTKGTGLKNINIGNYDGGGSKDLLVSDPLPKTADGIERDRWWLFTDNDVVYGVTDSIRVETSLGVSGLPAPFVTYQESRDGTCTDVVLFGFVQQDQYHSEREELFRRDLCDRGQEQGDWFYKRNGVLYFSGQNGEEKIYPK